jgi:hypothetical protein
LCNPSVCPAFEELLGHFHQASIDWDGMDWNGSIPVRPFS